MCKFIALPKYNSIKLFSLDYHYIPESFRLLLISEQFKTLTSKLFPRADKIPFEIK